MFSITYNITHKRESLTMIKISPLGKELEDYHPCMSCGVKNTVREIGFGINEVKNTVRLCNNCINDLQEKNSAISASVKTASS